MTETVPTQRLPSAGVLRRLGAMLYDFILIVALMALVTFLLLPLTGGEAVYTDRIGHWEYAYQALLGLIVFVFHGFCWTRSGQTLGMLAWRLRIEREDGSLLSWWDVAKRLVAATVSLTLALAGYLWIWVDRDKLAWPDRWTRTRVIVLPKNRS
jgi:uncharacterized RDD family membrane protein YckC